ncbi:Na+/H+ antiporter NhaC family protein [Gudongella sp. DL1XJH-153]|uniref:Na+/H+ antiporter NhaC family protein n=1 Tax=Gudongella sp. DL1XJH-153 TaxID=3409804 RepID=UPI003BB64062
MPEFITLMLFTTILLCSIITGFSLVAALFFGLVVFVLYALYRGFSIKSILQMIWNGIKSARTVIMVLTLIGVLTALWRAGGTIPYIIYHSVQYIDPRYFVVFAFLLCCLMSILIGTSFGSASTMGVICMTIGLSLGIDPFYTGGAILSGVYFGDRCSAMSSSASLVSELTGTNLFINIKNMLRTSIVPFLLTVAIYTTTGHGGSATPVSNEVLSVFSDNFQLAWAVVIPSIIIIVLPLFKLNLKKTMLTSIAFSAVICIAYQDMSISEILRTSVVGYSSTDSDLAVLMNGGGIFSMIKSISIVSISSSYFGIFRNTRLISKIRDWVVILSQHSSSFFTTLVTGILMSIISCNQTLATMLTYELNNNLIHDKYKLAIYLENTSIVIAPLIPWSIAGAFVLDTVGAPTSSILYSVYLYILPLYSLIVETIAEKRLKLKRV